MKEKGKLSCLEYVKVPPGIKRKSVYSNRSMFVAADTRLLKFGTMISIPGYSGARPVPVLDRGSKIRGYRLDVFYLSHRQAQIWGRRYLNVKVSLNNK